MHPFFLRAQLDRCNDKKDNKNFFKEFKAELKRVSWPTLKQVVNNTSAVIAIVVLIAVVVFVLDVIFENLNKFGVEKLKALVTSSSSETVDTNEVENNDTGVSNEAGTTEGNVETENNNTVETEDKTTETSEDGNSSVEGNN